jgi:hypothetical protein
MVDLLPSDPLLLVRAYQPVVQREETALPPGHHLGPIPTKPRYDPWAPGDFVRKTNGEDVYTFQGADSVDANLVWVENTRTGDRTQEWADSIEWVGPRDDQPASKRCRRT